jgi:hypothetical protein
VFKRIASLVLTGATAVVFQGVASAHTLTVTATASCSAGIPIISYTATSYDQTDIAGSNPEIDILFNGVKVDAEPFTLTTTPPNQFSGQMPAPSATNTVDVEAVAVGTWDDGFMSGETSTVTGLPIPTDCAPGTGRFTGGGKLIVGDVTVTKGFEVDCDLHQPSNNLEINWQDSTGAHQFHMENFLAARCTLNGNPVPPKAPVNTIVGEGTGRYDGADGYTVDFTLIDNGEPGVNDETGFTIFLTAPPHTAVLFVPLSKITSGNIQVHIDQR